MKIKQLFILIFLITGIHDFVKAQDGPPEYVRNAVDAAIEMLRSSDDGAIDTFINDSMTSLEGDPASYREQLLEMRNEVRGLWDDVELRPDPEGVLMILSGGGSQRNIKIEITPEGVQDLYFVEPPEEINLTRSNLAETFERLESNGMAGAAYIQVDGQILLETGFGMANEELGAENTTSTIFGIGSRPIDFTIAAIYLLEQQGLVDLDETIDQYFDDVPSDKQSITIRHLMTGQSGLPDFFHTNEDWDPDLAWIDRSAAENRIFNQTLLFEPGTQREHSHGAFVLLAALIEHLSGTTYFDFLHENFFEPAGMDRTHEYGIRDGFSITDFAVGIGHQRVGLPNIPPNWGPTSWLIKGSGGMYSTLEDLLKFYEFVRSGDVLDNEHREAFLQMSVNMDGSDRGFELFSIFVSPGNQAYLFLNDAGEPGKLQQITRAIERFIMQSGQ